MRLLAPPPLECRQAVELFSDYLDGALPRRLRRRVERHLAGCDACAAYLQQLRLAVEVSGRARPEDLEPDVLDGLVDMFRQVRSERQPPPEDGSAS